MFGGPEGLVIVVLLLVLFGGSQLPKLAKNLGEAQRELRKGMNGEEPVSSASTTPTSTIAQSGSLPAPTATTRSDPSSDTSGSA